MRTPIIIAAFAGLAVSGCTSSPSSPGTATPVNTGLNTLRGQDSPPPQPIAVADAKPTAVERLAQETRLDIQALLDQDAPAPEPQAPAPAVIAEAAPAEVTPPTPAEPAPEVPVEPPKTLPEKIDETSLLLTDLLRQNAAQSDAPFQSALALAAMEAIRPGSAPKVITPESVDGGNLTDEQRTLVNAFRDLVAGMIAAGNTKPDELTERAAELGSTFARARPMRIAATLAAKVTGFGQYIPLDVHKLQQGKPARAIVYTEVRRFAQRPIKEGDTGRTAQPGDRWAVELSQEIQLIHDADGVKAWQRPEQTILETSRSARTDFYLVQNITLPPTLSIGAYKLKVIVRDRIGGHEDEAIIPLEVVADPTLVSESPARLFD